MGWCGSETVIVMKDINLKHNLSNHVSTSDGVWVPGRSLVGGGEFVVDFDAIVHNVKELIQNLLAGKGKLHVTTTVDKCVKLKVSL